MSDFEEENVRSRVRVNPHVGKFVETSENDCGVGKITDSNRISATVEYFDSPVDSDHKEIEVAMSSLRIVLLHRQTRVYYLDREIGSWRMGRVQGHVNYDQDGGGTVFISLPNKETASVPAAEVYARWARPLKDPWEHLQAKLTESPYFHSSRHELVSHLVRQRASSMGMTGLISSAVEIEQHQVEVVRRILTDPVKRYLLADEVGLGKTIEAGIVLRQHILDRPNRHSILIVVPEGLLTQWKDELRTRCQIGPDFGHDIEFVSHEEIVKWDGAPLDFMVVDEAHQITAGPVFDRIKSLSVPENCQGLLLLSATPVLGNEAGFLGLLHLLDPTVYQLEDVDSFRTRVRKRQALADIFATFTPATEPFFLEGLSDQLGSLFPDDVRLQKMLAVLKPLLDEDSESFDSEALEGQVRRLRLHISETYRLHRRILRNRRGEAVQEVVTGRRNYVEIPWDDLAQSRVEEILEVWRSKAAETLWEDSDDSLNARELKFVFKTLFESALCDWMAFVLAAKIRLGNSDHVWSLEFCPILSKEIGGRLAEIPLFEGERMILEEVVKMAESLTNSRKHYLEQISRTIDLLLTHKVKVVCFATCPALADDLFNVVRLSRHIGIVRHSLKESDWINQWNDNTADVLICDYRAEEGLNLHGNNSCMVHLDFPFSPNRLEQRIGRLDRFGKGKPVKSFAIHRKQSPYWEGWESCLNSAWKVFERSIASLQYVVEEEMEALLHKLFEEGDSAIGVAAERLIGEGGRIETEWREIRNQDDLDSLEVELNEDGENQLVAEICNYDEDADAFQSAFEKWMVDLLQFRKKEKEGVKNGPIQYQYRETDHGPQTLLSISDLKEFYSEAIESMINSDGNRKALTPALVFKRPKAIARSVDLGRLGNRMIEAVRSHLAWDDRGTSFALWRQSQVLGQNEGEAHVARAFIRFDYIVEAALPYSSSESLKRKADGILRPAVETIWLDQDLLPPNENILKVLELSYSEEDINLRPEFWPFALIASGISDWRDLCEAARPKAMITARERLALDERIDEALRRHKISAALVEEQIRSRIDAVEDGNDARKQELEQDLAEVGKQASIISEGIKTPSMRLDACGVAFLSAVPLSEAAKNS